MIDTNSGNGINVMLSIDQVVSGKQKIIRAVN